MPPNNKWESYILTPPLLRLLRFWYTLSFKFALVFQAFEGGWPPMQCSDFWLLEITTGSHSMACSYLCGQHLEKDAKKGTCELLSVNSSCK